MTIGNPRVDAFGTQLPGEQEFIVGGAGGDTDRKFQLHLFFQCLFPAIAVNGVIGAMGDKPK
jgi:hypothetical protein